jgi:hypothetical protein
MTKTIEDILLPKPQVRPKIYAYSIEDKAHSGLLKVGQTTRDVKQRVAEQLRTAAIKNYKIEIESDAIRHDGSFFSDHEVRARLIQKRFQKSTLEWIRCSVKDVKTAITELQTGQRLSGERYEQFGMRDEQASAVDKTYDYFHSIWKEDKNSAPRFLWNAKMRFGKTFGSYQLAKKLNAKRVLVVTFKPAVEDAWQADLESHVDFEGWQYMSRVAGGDPTKVKNTTPLVYFGSLQDLLGKDTSGNIKAKNEWLHTINWDLVIFDEYHFGAWRETAKELFASDEDRILKQESLNDDSKVYKEKIADLSEPLGNESDFLPITSRSYLYLSGTPFKALSSGEFIEEQIFNWTYTDEQRAKESFTSKHPEERNPYAALPQMRLLTYQMPDELLAVASGGEFDEFDLNSFFEATGEGRSAKFKYKNDVQKWLDIIRGGYLPQSAEMLKIGKRPPFPYSDIRLLPYLQHSFWFFHSVSS